MTNVPSWGGWAVVLGMFVAACGNGSSGGTGGTGGSGAAGPNGGSGGTGAGSVTGGQAGSGAGGNGQAGGSACADPQDPCDCPICPFPAPAEGASCADACPSDPCEYQQDDCVVVASCDGQVWHLTEHCEPCTGLAEGACSEHPGCRWITPTCYEVPEAFCSVITSCEEGTCPDGLTCQGVVAKGGMLEECSPSYADPTEVSLCVPAP